MKKGIVLVLAGLLTLAMCAVASAAEVGNISFLREKGGFTLGLYAEHLTRQMELKEPSALVTTGDTSVHQDQYFPTDPVSGDYGYIKTSTSTYWTYLNLTGLEEIETIDRYFLKASFKLGRVQVYGKYGLARLISKWEHYWMEGYSGWEDVYVYEDYTWNGEEWELTDTSKCTSGHEDDLKIESPIELGLEQSDWGTFYGAGLKFIIYSKPEFKAAFDAQYGYQKNKRRGFFAGSTSYKDWGEEYYPMIYGNGGTSYSAYGITGEIKESETTEMHAALLLSGIMGKLSPYGGLKYSRMETKYKGRVFAWNQSDSTYTETPITSFEYTMKQKDSFGMFAGADYHFTKRLTGKFEIRLLDETAFSTGLEFKI